MKISNLFKYIFKLNNNMWQNLYYTHHQSLTNIFPPAFGSLIDFWKSLVDMGCDTDFAMYYFWFIKIWIKCMWTPWLFYSIHVYRCQNYHLIIWLWIFVMNYFEQLLGSARIWVCACNWIKTVILFLERLRLKGSNTEGTQ